MTISRVDSAVASLDAAAERMRTARRRLRVIQPLRLPATGELEPFVSLRVLSESADVIMMIDRSNYARVFVTIESLHGVGPALVFRTVDADDANRHDPYARRACFFRLSELPDLADAISEALTRTATLYERAADHE